MTTPTPKPPQPPSLLPPQGAATPKPPSLLEAAPPPAPKPFDPDTDLRDFGDHKTTRRWIYDKVFAAARGIKPEENATHALRLTNVRWGDPDVFARAAHKQALLAGGSLARRLHGTWELVDRASGKVVDKRDHVIARVPHLTDHGTFVNNGNEYTLNHQQRLLPGVFVRRKDNGELEAHANVLPGKGVSHRYFLDPEKNHFKINIGQAEMPLLDRKSVV